MTEPIRLAESESLNHPEPPPQPNDAPAVWELVLEDMAERDRVGRAKYGTPLQAHNGRKPLVDAYQESLDLVVYLRQELEETGRLRAKLESTEAQVGSLIHQRDSALMKVEELSRELRLIGGWTRGDL